MLLLLFVYSVFSSVTHSCLVSPETAVHRVDLDGGTWFYIQDEIDRKYCLQMTSAYSKVTEPTKFVCRECMFHEFKPEVDVTANERKNALCLGACGLLCIFVGVLIANIFGPMNCEHEELIKND